MEGSTLTRPASPNGVATPPAPARAHGERAARVVFVLLCVGFLIGFFVFPTYPVYDSYYSLLWGRDLMHGDPLVFDGFRYPTQHPLAIAAGAILQLFGGVADEQRYTPGIPVLYGSTANRGRTASCRGSLAPVAMSPPT